MKEGVTSLLPKTIATRVTKADVERGSPPSQHNVDEVNTRECVSLGGL